MYQSSLSDSEWQIIEKKLDKKMLSRQRKYSLRLIFNAIFYHIKSGCQWRMLPQDLMPWASAYYYFNRWKKEGLLEELHDSLREALRHKVGKKKEASAGLIDSQSVKTSRQGGPRGLDGGKKVKGRKRHILVDTLGLLLGIVVHPANIHDSKGAWGLLYGLRGCYGRLHKIWADGGYRGQLAAQAKTQLGWELEIVERKQNWKGFQVLPKRWIVERTFAWLEGFRVLAKDYERLPDTSEAKVRLAMIRLMVKRLK